ncbi:hypothetical protein COCON_G00174510 [Conger conger]|uniref:Uncharacterized protein n=1 Tax=Conger conger TaxID=82655 RepID=A0A9Q1D4B6_CONCO|nr:hypothetical protein COCON_G00174510 [Conger conger]
MEPETRDYFFKAQAVVQELQMALKDQPMAAGSLRKTFAEAVFQKVAVKRPPAFTSSSGFSTKQEALHGKRKDRELKLMESQKQGGHQQLTIPQQNREHRREERPRWVKAFGNYRPNQWITDGQGNNYRCSQAQMASRRLWKNAA